MAYEFGPEERVREAFTRNAAEQLDRAVQELTDGVRVDREKSVHDARKALKMERSLLRLARGSLRRGQRRGANARLREIARGLSGARDADVMIGALDGLAGRYAGQVPEATFKALRERLETDRDRLRAEAELTGSVEGAVSALREVRAQSAGWRLRAGGWAAIEPGLRLSYARGRGAMAAARAGTHDESLHDWRKRAKDLWYHLRLLEPAAPELLDGHTEAAHALADLLGDDHDLAVLHERLLALAPEVAVDVGPVIALLEHRRAHLQQAAFAAGARLYAERPKAFTARMRSYWKASRAQARAQAAEHPAELAESTRQAPVV